MFARITGYLSRIIFYNHRLSFRRRPESLYYEARSTLLRSQESISDKRNAVLRCHEYIPFNQNGCSRCLGYVCIIGNGCLRCFMYVPFNQNGCSRCFMYVSGGRHILLAYLKSLPAAGIYAGQARNALLLRDTYACAARNRF